MKELFAIALLVRFEDNQFFLIKIYRRRDVYLIARLLVQTSQSADSQLFARRGLHGTNF